MLQECFFCFSKITGSFFSFFRENMLLYGFRCFHTRTTLGIKNFILHTLKMFSKIRLQFLHCIPIQVTTVRSTQSTCLCLHRISQKKLTILFSLILKQIWLSLVDFFSPTATRSDELLQQLQDAPSTLRLTKINSKQAREKFHRTPVVPIQD